MNAYKGWDAHAYTQDMCQLLDDEKWRGRIPTRVDPYFHAQLMYELKQRYYSNVRAIATISKMARRYQPHSGGYRDPHLHGVNVTGVLWMTWQQVKRANDNSVYDGFAETLQDIGGTCVQGDSHRLLSYCVALEDSLD